MWGYQTKTLILGTTPMKINCLLLYQDYIVLRVVNQKKLTYPCRTLRPKPQDCQASKASVFLPWEVDMCVAY